MNALRTLPPTLQIPAASADTDRLTRLYRIGKGYAVFYKTGVVNVWNNRRAANRVKERPESEWTRAEFQLVRRTQQDFRKLPLFGLVLLVCGEFTPFVVLALPMTTPSACRIPRQVHAAAVAMRKRREMSFQTFPELTGARLGLDVQGMARSQLLHCSRILNLHPRLLPEFLLPVDLLRRRVAGHLHGYLARDDALVQKHGGPKKMHEDEASVALEERGIDSVGKTAEQMHNDLLLWLKLRRQPDIKDELLLWRPDRWKTAFHSSDSIDKTAELSAQ